MFNSLRLRRKFVALLSLFSLTLNIFQPVIFAFALATPVSAETVSESPSPEPSTSPEPSESPEPTLAPAPEPSPEPTSTPDATLEPSPSVEPTSTPSPTDPAVPDESAPPVEPVQDSLPAPPTDETTPTPGPELNESLDIAILDHTSASSIEEFDLEVTETGSATLSTDKLDYAPTDTALITGAGFLAHTIYTLTISSEDDPTTSTTVEVTTDESGTLFYAYQLDGIYRPNYKVDARDGSGNIVATITFTDSDTGAKNGTTFASVSFSGSDHSWSNPSNAATSNNSRATSTITSSSNVTDYLRSTGFGFTIPSDATVTGIEVSIERSGNSISGVNGVRDNIIRLVKNNTVVGNNKANTGLTWPTTDTVATYGNASDLWGTTWSPAEINHANFGVALSATRTSGGDRTAQVDHVSIKVHYTENTPPVANPALTSTCGIDVGLIVDTSTSIDNTELAQMKTALKSFINAFVGTPTQMAVVSFDDVASIESGFTSNLSALTAPSGVIDDIDGSGYTNWEDALQDTRLLFPNRADKPDLIVFTSDGNPTASNTGGSNNTSQPNAHLSPAITQANLAKAAGIRIITLGIGNDLSASNLQSISSADAYYSAADFGALTATLQQLATDLCGGTITVNKYIDEVSPNTRGGSGWTFSVTGPNAYSNSLSTDSNGQDTADQLVAGSPYSVLETGNVAGYAFESAVCRNQAGQIEGTATQNGVNNINVSDSDIITCDFVNTTLPQTGKLLVQKTTIPASDQTMFPITATGSGEIVGDEDALISDSQDHEYEMDAGTYEIEEDVPEGWAQTSNTCVDVVVVAGQTATCTIENTRLGSISGYKYEDSDGSLSTTDDRSPLADWVINLYKWVTDSYIFQTFTTTDSNGYYSFSDLLPALYSVREDTSNPAWTNMTTATLNQTLAAGAQETGLNFLNTTLPENKITICHATSSHVNPYTKNNVSINSIINLPNGHHYHNGPVWYPAIDEDWGDIIPEFTHSGGTYPGKNWDDVGQAYYRNDCERPTGKITIIKDSLPNDGQDFRFTTTLGSSFILDDDGNPHNSRSNKKVFNNVADGTYTVTEALESGWKLTELSCNDQNSQTNLNTRTATIHLELGEEVTCTFKNTKLGKIFGYKFEDENANGFWNILHGEKGLGSWRIFIDQGDKNGLYDAGEPYTWTSNFFLTRGYFDFTGLLPGTYTVCEDLNSKPGWVNTTPLCQTRHVTPGDIDSAYFGNVRNGNLEVTKYNDVNGNGQFDDGEDTLSDWEINLLKHSSKLTGENGVAKFQNVLSDWYDLSETMQDGWTQTNITCSTDREEEEEFLAFQVLDLENDLIENGHSTHSLYINPGQTTYCQIGNQMDPQLVIEKSNNATGPQNPGSSVLYTIKLELQGSNVNSVVLKDTTPTGFTYRPLSWTANSSVRGDLSGLGEPTYASPGTWQLGDMIVGEVVTLTYLADISSSQDAGVYKDIAWARGLNSFSSAEVLAQGQNSQYVDGIFVGTNVEIVVNAQETGTVNIEKTGEVLGASTELPATGAPSFYLVLALSSLLSGIMLILFGKRLKLIAVLLILATACLMTPSSSVMAATDGDSNISVRMYDPFSPTRLANWKLSFTTLDKMERELTIKCYVKKPGASFVQFDTDKILSGGGTGSCQVDNSIMSAQGTYEFYVSATAGTGVDETDTAPVIYDTEGPGRPTNYSKEHPTECRWVIKFKTADDGGLTQKVEIYSSTSTNFDTHAGTRVGTVTLGSNQDGQFTHDRGSDCNQTWYYVIRAFDSLGNQSAHIGDELTSITTITPSPTTSAQALLVSGAGLLGEGSDTPTQTGDILGEEEVVEEVLSESIAERATDAVTTTLKNKSFWWLVLVVIALRIVYGITRKKA